MVSLYAQLRCYYHWAACFSDGVRPLSSIMGVFLLLLLLPRVSIIKVKSREPFVCFNTDTRSRFKFKVIHFTILNWLHWFADWTNRKRLIWSSSFSFVIKLLNSIHFTEGKLETCQPMITLIGMIVVVIIRLTFGHFSNNQFTHSFLHILVTCQYKFTAAWNFGFTILGNSSTRTGALLGSIGFAELA